MPIATATNARCAVLRGLTLAVIGGVFGAAGGYGPLVGTAFGLAATPLALVEFWARARPSFARAVTAVISTWAAACLLLGLAIVQSYFLTGLYLYGLAGGVELANELAREALAVDAYSGGFTVFQDVEILGAALFGATVYAFSTALRTDWRAFPFAVVPVALLFAITQDVVGDPASLRTGGSFVGVVIGVGCLGLGAMPAGLLYGVYAAAEELEAQLWPEIETETAENSAPPST